MHSGFINQIRIFSLFVNHDQFLKFTYLVKKETYKKFKWKMVETAFFQ